MVWRLQRDWRCLNRLHLQKCQTAPAARLLVHQIAIIQCVALLSRFQKGLYIFIPMCTSPYQE